MHLCLLGCSHHRLLLQITAMRYACLNHTDATACASDTSNWCNYNEDSSQCRLQYDDADFVGMLLWSVTSIACKGSRLAEVVACSMYVAQKDCTAAACEWAEQACYPPWYSGMIDDVNLLADFKKQVSNMLHRIAQHGRTYAGWWNIKVWIASQPLLLLQGTCAVSQYACLATPLSCKGMLCISA
jgi:hypothetical protein